MLVQEIVLREGAIGLVLWNRGRGKLHRVEHHYNAGDAAECLVLLGDEVDAERDERFQRVALLEELLASVRAQIDQVLREGKRLRLSASGQQQESDSDSAQVVADHVDLPL